MELIKVHGPSLLRLNAAPAQQLLALPVTHAAIVDPPGPGVGSTILTTCALPLGCKAAGGAHFGLLFCPLTRHTVAISK